MDGPHVALPLELQPDCDARSYTDPRCAVSWAGVTGPQRRRLNSRSTRCSSVLHDLPEAPPGAWRPEGDLNPGPAKATPTALTDRDRSFKGRTERPAQGREDLGLWDDGDLGVSGDERFQRT